MANHALTVWSRREKFVPPTLDGKYIQELLFMEKNEIAAKRRKKKPSHLIVSRREIRYLFSRGLIQPANPTKAGREFEFKLTEAGRLECAFLRESGVVYDPVKRDRFRRYSGSSPFLDL